LLRFRALHRSLGAGQPLLEVPHRRLSGHAFRLQRVRERFIAGRERLDALLTESLNLRLRALVDRS
jgi:hypothetical protein